MSDAPDKMWVAPFPTLADAAIRQARNDALREAEEKVVNRLNEELPARACRIAATNSD